MVSSCESMKVMDPSSLLDVVINDYDKRVGVCYGSSREVERFVSYIYHHSH